MTSPLHELLMIQDQLYEVLDQNRGESVTFPRRTIEVLYLEVSKVIEENRPPVSYVSPAVTPDPSKGTGPGAGGHGD